MEFSYSANGLMSTDDTNNIQSYQLIDSKKSGTSAVIRGGIGAALLGPVGLLAAASATKKYSVLLTFKSGKNIVATVDESALKKILENVT